MFEKTKEIASNAYARAGVAVTMVALSLPAAAQSSDAVETAISTVQGKAVTYATALLGATVAVIGFFVGIKYVKKLRGAV